MTATSPLTTADTTASPPAVASPAATRRPVRPRRLVPGDRAVIVAPSGPVPEDRLDAGVTVLRSWGLNVAVAPHVRDSHRNGYLAGRDADRAGDLQAAWLDPSVAAIVCARGGYGAQRMVDLLDWEAIRAAGPKVFTGFSDITALHEAFAVRAGFATLHGPGAAGVAFTGDAPTREHLRRTLFAPESVLRLTSPTARALVPGRASGVTAGGCLSLLAAEVGTRGARQSFRDAVLLLEDIAEEPYRLDRCLTQLLRSGLLDGVAGIALGSWEGCGPTDRVREVMLDRLGPLGVPVLWELGFGHCPSHLTVPLGVPAVLDADAGELVCEVPALEP